jgi:hypothetical protein
MLSESIINTYSSWKNNRQQNTFQTPLVKLPPKYTNNPLGMGGTAPLASPYLSNSNILLANHSKSVSTAMVPIKYNGVYGNYIFMENQKQDSVIAEDGSEIDVVDIDESEMIDLDSDSDAGSDGIRTRDSPVVYINLDNYKLNDPIIQFYFGSITVIGLFILFRLMSKTK